MVPRLISCKLKEREGGLEKDRDEPGVRAWAGCDHEGERGERG